METMRNPLKENEYLRHMVSHYDCNFSNLETCWSSGTRTKTFCCSGNLISKEEVNAYNSLNECALSIFIQVIHGEIPQWVVEMETTNQIWLHLKSLYHWDIAFALVHQVGSFCQLGWKFSHTRPISEFIKNFESERFKLLKLTRNSSDTYRQQQLYFLKMKMPRGIFYFVWLVVNIKI